MLCELHLVPSVMTCTSLVSQMPVSLGLHNTGTQYLQIPLLTLKVNSLCTSVFLYFYKHVHHFADFVTYGLYTSNSPRPEFPISSGKPTDKAVQNLRLKLPSSPRVLKSSHITKYKFRSPGPLQTGSSTEYQIQILVAPNPCFDIH